MNCHVPDHSKRSLVKETPLIMHENCPQISKPKFMPSDAANCASAAIFRDLNILKSYTIRTELNAHEVKAFRPTPQVPTQLFDYQMF